MPSKSLKVSISLSADQVEDAIVFLSDRYLKMSKTTCKVIQTPTEYCLVDLCKPLVEGWIAGKVNYEQGKITLIFRSGSVDDEADMLIYAPLTGDRFLYSRPRRSTFVSEYQSDDQLSLFGQTPDKEGVQHISEKSAQLLQDLISRQDSLEGKLAQLLDMQSKLNLKSEQPLDFFTLLKQSLSSDHPPLVSDIEPLMQRLKEQLTERILENITTALQPLQQTITDLRDQITEISDRMDDLEDVSFVEDEIHIPQSREDWLERIEETWGTVGDYERYNSTYRDANAETPLHDTPDWVALCELDWARVLCPALNQLYTLIHDPQGIGYEGADILQQFGQHVDPESGDTYYIYQNNGFTAFEAFQQIIYSPDYSWLPELKNLWKKLASPNHEIFQMFGWEADAIAALKAITLQTTQGQRSEYSRYYQHAQTPSPQPSIKEYRAMLNLGPFTPITTESIKRAYHEAMKTAHPDSGGSTEYAQRVNEAYDAMMKHYFPKTN